MILCSEIDAISGGTFASLIQESFVNNKGFIIARVKTRSNSAHDKKFFHYFNACNLIQILVKPNINFLEKILSQTNSSINKEDNQLHILRSRYHLDYPLCVRNPLTNQIIVGEVEFYLVSRQHIEEQCVASRPQVDQEIILSAYYIGSDYTYAYSQKFRDTIFRENTVDESLLIGLTKKSPAPNQPDQGNDERN